MKKHGIVLSTVFVMMGCQTKKSIECGDGAVRAPNGMCSTFYNDPILGLPRTPEDIRFIKLEDQRLTEFLSGVPDVISKGLKERAVELVPKNASLRTNWYGEEYGVKDGSIVRFLADGTSLVEIPGSVLPKDAGFAGYRVSPDKSKIAFAYSKFGSDWQVWQVYDRTTKQVLTVDGEFVVKGFGGPVVSWTLDSKGFYYPKGTDIESDFNGNRTPQVNMHIVGQSQKSDKLIFEDPETTKTSIWNVVNVTEHMSLAFRVQGVATVPMAAYAVNLKTGHRTPVLPLNKYLGNSPGNVIVGVKDGIAYVRTAQVGNKFGIMSVDLRRSRPATRVVIPNDPKSSLYQATILGDKIVTQNINNDLSVEYRIYDLGGKLINVMKPSEHGLSDWGHPSLPFMEANATSTTGYFTHSSVERPSATFKVDAKEGKFIRVPDTAEVNFDYTKIERKIVTYQGKDGKDVQMFLYQRKDLGDRPATFAYLYSYGFIGVPNLPQWNRKFQLALEMGAVVAIPVIRGGGEHGANWQLEGTNDRWKTFDDLVYASRWLKKNVAIDGKRVAIVGRSFGGLSGSAHFVHNQNEFDLISSIVPVTDWQKHFAGTGWWMGDDFGIHRNPKTGLASAKDIEGVINRANEWNPAKYTYKLKGQKLIPVVFFSEQYDTNTTPHQTFTFVQKLRVDYPDQPIYMREHPNGGHASRLELVDELLFIAKSFALTEYFPLRK